MAKDDILIFSGIRLEERFFIPFTLVVHRTHDFYYLLHNMLTANYGVLKIFSYISVSQGTFVKNEKVKCGLTSLVLVDINFSFVAQATQNMCLNPYNDVEDILRKTNLLDV